MAGFRLRDTLRLGRRTPDERRLRVLGRAAPGPVRDLLAEPLPDAATPVGDLRLLALDLETTGLDPATDRILSIGFVPVAGHEIRLGGARRLLVRQPGGHGDGAGVGASATIHGLTDDALAAGLELADALAVTLAALRGRALLAHFADMEVGFLTRACERVFGDAPVFTCVDTMHLQYRLLTRGFDDDPPRDGLRLWTARQRYGLPTYRAHEALTDALACAELYLALLAEPGVGATLGELQR